MIGKTRGRDQITSRLGRGGIGVANKAEDTKLKRSIAAGGGFTGEAIAALDRRASFRLSAQSAVCFLIQKSLSVSQANIQEEVNP
jgi:pyrroline-5-carboxylate reductase